MSLLLSDEFKAALLLGQLGPLAGPVWVRLRSRGRYGRIMWRARTSITVAARGNCVEVAFSPPPEPYQPPREVKVVAEVGRGSFVWARTEPLVIPAAGSLSFHNPLLVLS